MSLNNRLKKVKSIGDERKITLRIPSNKSKILELLAEHYETNISTIIRELIDDGIRELQKEYIVLNETVETSITSGKDKRKVQYFPDVVALITPELEANFLESDFCNDIQAYEDFVVKNSLLSQQHGNSLGISFISKITNKEINTIGEK